MGKEVKTGKRGIERWYRGLSLFLDTCGAVGAYLPFGASERKGWIRAFTGSHLFYSVKKSVGRLSTGAPREENLRDGILRPGPRREACASECRSCTAYPARHSMSGSEPAQAWGARSIIRHGWERHRASLESRHEACVERESRICMCVSK